MALAESNVIQRCIFWEHSKGLKERFYSVVGVIIRSVTAVEGILAPFV